MRRTEPLPGWVAVTPEAFDECYRVLWRHLESGWSDDRDRGALGTLVWLTIGEASPMTVRSAGELSRETARAESWVALCAAAGMPGPTERDWQRLGASTRPAREVSREYAYGAWRALAWLLGVREDWPAHTSWHQASEVSPERPHLYLPRSQWHCPAWEAAAQASRDQAAADALTHWRHVRRLADTTDMTACGGAAGWLAGHSPTSASAPRTSCWSAV